MATVEIAFLQNQLEERKSRLKTAIALEPQRSGLAGLLREVDSALERMAKGSYGLCQECHESIEQDRLMADPLVCYCLDHLSASQRAALQRDLELASQVQRNLLPQMNLCTGNWETSYHYAPVGAVSGDYCDLIPSDGQLFFVLGDVSGKGVAASMLMAQLHALFRSLSGRTCRSAGWSPRPTAFSVRAPWPDSTPRWCADKRKRAERWKSITRVTCRSS
jgi:phosphoserine phosphatase RsbU/P